MKNYLFIVVTGIALGLASVLSSELPDLSSNMKFVVFSGIVILCIFLNYFKFRNNDLLSPIYLTSFIYFIIFGVSIYSDIYLSNKYFVIICFSYILMFIGIEAGDTITQSPSTPQTINYTENSISKAYTLGRLMFWGCFVLYAYQASKNGIALLSANINLARTLATYGNTNGYMATLSTYFFVPVAIWFFSFIIDDDVKNVLKLKMSIYFSTSIMILLSTGSRHDTVIILGSCAIFYYYKKKPSIKKVSLLGFCAVLILLVVQIYRSGRGLNFDSLMSTLFLELKVNSANLSYVIDLFEPSSFLHGKGLLMSFGVLLPGRQIDISLFLKEYLRMTFEGGGVTPSIMGLYYMDFGYAGIVLGMFLYGFICVLIYRWMKNKTDRYSIILYSITLMYLLLSIRNGILYDPVTFSYIILFLLIKKYVCPTRKDIITR